jgi:hypothetical protein
LNREVSLKEDSQMSAIVEFDSTLIIFLIPEQAVEIKFVTCPLKRLKSKISFSSSGLGTNQYKFKREKKSSGTSPKTIFTSSFLLSLLPNFSSLARKPLRAYLLFRLLLRPCFDISIAKRLFQANGTIGRDVETVPCWSVFFAEAFLREAAVSGSVKQQHRFKRFD